MAHAVGATASQTPPTGLRFTALGGPLVAVVGLCGGAGVSTLTHLIGTAAAGHSTVPILVADTGGPTATLALYVGARSRRSLAELACALDRGDDLPGPPFAVASSGLRVLAADPGFDMPASREAIVRVLGDAQAAHGLTVIDCGSLTGATDRLALRAANHVLWVTPATSCAARRAHALFDRLDLSLPGRELLVARHDTTATRAPLGELLALAQRRRAPLALIPHVAGYDHCGVEQRIERAGVALQALAGVLHR